ncbi:hypothetical protein [Leucobacter sp. G161]|uniref:hypothetical protein n=1 Tax=Leucobacter sp. G161 TaxID=663704 RepID=UPI00073BBAF0|nr:hypothetical protein [Leucobacter sp. G161]KUF07195.1 hypothetical protein AUL38_02595 [Leucobacter sp. G161]
MSVWLVDDVDLDDVWGRWAVDWGTAVPAPAQRRVSKLVLPNLDGAISRRQGWGSGAVNLTVSIYEAGASAESSAIFLAALFARAGTLTRVMADGTRRTAEVVDMLVAEPERLSLKFWRLRVQFETQPFWCEGAPVAEPALPVPGEVVFPRWAGTTGDVQDGVIRVKGPAESVKITGSDGRGLSFTHSLSASQYVFVDVRAFRAWRGGASAWAPTGTRVPLDYPPAGALRLSPASDGLRLAVAGSGFTDDSSITVRGAKWWL